MTTNTKKLRYERKYLLDRDTAFYLMQRVSYVLSPDSSSPDGSYRVSSMYFDDQYNTSFYEKKNGVLRRNKFRARFYNRSMDKIRLECKHKHDKMICKEASDITLNQYQMMCENDYDFMREQQSSVFEQFYTTHTLKRMRPVIMVEYMRQAYMHPTGNVRLTFDSDLSACKPQTDVSHSVIPTESIILEIKYDNFIPLFINELITGAQFTQQLSISKFVMAKLTLQCR